MRTLIYLLLLTTMAAFTTSCIEETCDETVTYLGFSPSIVTTDDFRSNSFICGAPLPVCEAIGFYVYEDYLFMVEGGNDKESGIHIFDNSNPNNPASLTFMAVPGGQGIAVRNSILYINQYTDLLAFDLSNPERPEFISRTEDVFDPYSVFAEVRSDGSFITSWNATGDVRFQDCNVGNQYWESGVLFENADFQSVSLYTNANSSADVVGRGGSLARFTITKGTLYAVDNSSLRAFSLDDPRKPVYVDSIQLGWNIETIFPTSDKLFIGSSNGVHIFGVDDPLNPEHLSSFEHVLGCDPVVVSGDLAYVTLWGGRDCGSVGDQLEVIDISDARNPVSLQITPMDASHGLGVAEGKLFLCKTSAGFATYDLTDDGLLGELISQDSGINARDVIVLPENNQAIVLSYYQGGIQQYAYSDAGQLTRTSTIDVCQ